VLLGLFLPCHPEGWRHYGEANRHNGFVPRDFWLEPCEREAIIAFAAAHPVEGSRRLTCIMLDRDIVAVSPSSTYQVLKQAGLIRTWDAVSMLILTVTGSVMDLLTFDQTFTTIKPSFSASWELYKSCTSECYFSVP